MKRGFERKATANRGMIALAGPEEDTVIFPNLRELISP